MSNEFNEKNYLVSIITLTPSGILAFLLDFISKMELHKTLDPMMVVPHKEFGALVEAVPKFQYTQLPQIIAVEQ